jgi:hypothetical protein
MNSPWVGIFWRSPEKLLAPAVSPDLDRPLSRSLDVKSKSNSYAAKPLAAGHASK